MTPAAALDNPNRNPSPRMRGCWCVIPIPHPLQGNPFPRIEFAGSSSRPPAQRTPRGTIKRSLVVVCLPQPRRVRLDRSIFLVAGRSFCGTGFQPVFVLALPPRRLVAYTVRHVRPTVVECAGVRLSMPLNFYFRPRTCELNGKLYEWLGVLRFKRALMSVVRVNLENVTANGYVLGGRSPEHLRAFEKRTRRSELIHLGGLAVSALCLCLGVWSGRGMFVPAVVIFAANFHCFILQRYNRIRILRVLERASRLPAQ